MDSDSDVIAEDNRRELAIKRLKKKRDFRTHLVIYLVVNAALIGIWAASGTDNFFWPVFVIVGWGIGLAANAWDVYGQKPIGEEEIRREMDRLGRGGED